MKYANIIPFTYTECLTYQVPARLESKISVGQVVEIPFGKKKTTGVVLDLISKTEFQTRPINTIVASNPVITETQVAIVNHLSSHYFSSAIKALKTVLLDSDMSLSKGKKSRANGKSKMFAILENKQEKIYKKILNKKSQSLLLFPDKKSISDFLLKNKVRLKNQKYTVFNSGIKKDAKKLLWQNINTGETKIIIGTRSALFLPFENLTTIVLYAPYEDGYRQEATPRYDTTEIAEFIAKEIKATFIIQSDVLTTDIYYKLQNGYKLMNNFKKQSINLLNEPSYPLIGAEAEREIVTSLKNKGKVVLFINNTGNKSVIMCAECKNTIKCKKCNNVKILEKNVTKCKFCNDESLRPTLCPKCGSTKLFSPGINILKIKKELEKIFPKNKITTLDKKNNTTNLKQSEVIVATSEIKQKTIGPVKTLVLMYPEILTKMPYYNSDERSMYMFLSIINKLNPEKTIIKTTDKKNKIVKAMLEDKTTEIIKNKMLDLKKYGYPPFMDIIEVTIKGKNAEEINHTLIQVKKYFTKHQVLKIEENSTKESKPRSVNIVIKTMKNSVEYDKILRSFKNITIERNPIKSI